MKVLRQELKNLDHIQKGKWLKKLLEQHGFDVRNYKSLLHKVTRLHTHQRKKVQNLKKDEVILNDFLLKEKINPRTAEDWIMALLLPDDIKYRYRSGEIHFRDAYKEWTETKRQTKAEILAELREDILNAIRRF